MSSNINHSTGEVVSNQSSRFTLWAALLIFSAITLGSSVEVKKEQDTPSKAAKFTVACSAITLALTAIIVGFHLFHIYSPLVVGTTVEGASCFLMTALWAATVSVVTNASNSLGISDNSGKTTDLNGNLYYGSWAGFITAVILLVNYFREVFGVDVVGQVRNRAARLSLWAGFLAAALISMGSASRTFNNDCGSNSLLHGSTYCRRTKFAISTGTLSVALALGVIGVKLLTTSAPFIIEFGVAIVLAVLDAFGVAFITSAKGPGSSIGNLYYSSWIAFVLAALIASDCFKQFTGADAAGANTSNGMNEPKNRTQADLPVHELNDDQI